MCLIHNIIPKENDRMTDFFFKKIFRPVRLNTPYQLAIR